MIKLITDHSRSTCLVLLLSVCWELVCVCVEYNTIQLPPVNFNMLSIKKENGSWSNGDVKVFSVDWYSVTIHTVYVRHFGQ